MCDIAFSNYCQVYWRIWKYHWFILMILPFLLNVRVLWHDTRSYQDTFRAKIRSKRWGTEKKVVSIKTARWTQYFSLLGRILHRWQHIYLYTSLGKIFSVPLIQFVWGFYETKNINFGTTSTDDVESAAFGKCCRNLSTCKQTKKFIYWSGSKVISESLWKIAY
jgi:hypothetical protein